jgi:phage terminase large subunit GpA-like protein
MVAFPTPQATPAVDVIGETIARAKQRWLPPPDFTVSEFADAEVIVASGPRARTKWQTSIAPYQKGIMDGIHEPNAEHEVIMGSSQWGKTAIALNVVAFHIAHDPCDILVVQPTVKPMAERFAKRRLDPTIKASPALDAAVDKKRSKDASNTTLLKTFRGGSVGIVGANSAASLASSDIRVLVLDEVDRYERSLGDEGDPISIAIKRTTTFRNRRRILITSSPTVVDGPIHTWYQRGDQRKYFVPCPGCGTFHTYEWKNVKWDNENPQTARLHCPECDYQISEVERVALLPFGEWRATNPNPEPDVISFHIWEAYSPFSSLKAIVIGFMRARAAQKAGDPEPMRTWQNTTLGEPVEPDRGDGVESSALLLRREDYGAEVDLPEGVCCLTMSVDTQDDRLEVLVVGWGLGDESWIVDRQTIPGDTSLATPWEALDVAMAVEYRHALGSRLPIRAIAIDSAGHRTTTVYHYAALWAARRVMAIIGRDGQRAIVSTPSPRRFGQGERQVPLYTFGVDAAKALLMSRLKLTNKGPGYIHLPRAAWCDDEFAAQLTSERLKTTFERGIKTERWIKIRPRNEALDCYVYALGAFLQQQPDHKRRQDWLAQLAAELRRDRPPVPPPPVPPRSGWIPHRPNWLRGGR